MGAHSHSFFLFPAYLAQIRILQSFFMLLCYWGRYFLFGVMIKIPLNQHNGRSLITAAGS